jgi:hypothetical protein
MARVIGLDPLNNEELRRIRSQYHLSRKTIATICGVSESLVDLWLLPPGNKVFQAMPEKSMRLLKLELGLVASSFLHVREQGEKFKAKLLGVA